MWRSTSNSEGPTGFGSPIPFVHLRLTWEWNCPTVVNCISTTTTKWGPRTIVINGALTGPYYFCPIKAPYSYPIGSMGRLYIYLHLVIFYMVNVSKYTVRPMDCLFGYLSLVLGLHQKHSTNRGNVCCAALTSGWQ